MTSGKKLVKLFIIFTLSSLCYTSLASPSVLRGGLVYSEESSLGPVYLNRDYVSFVRTVDTSVLEQSAQATRDFTTLYHTFCQTVGKHITPFDSKASNTTSNNEPVPTHEIVFSPVTYHVKEGKQVCKNMGARMPEIRDRDSYNDIRFAAIKKRIKKIRAGVYSEEDTSTYLYYSNNKPANYDPDNLPFQFNSYRGICYRWKYKATWEKNTTLTR